MKKEIMSEEEYKSLMEAQEESGVLYRKQAEIQKEIEKKNAAIYKLRSEIALLKAEMPHLGCLIMEVWDKYRDKNVEFIEEK